MPDVVVLGPWLVRLPALVLLLATLSGLWLCRLACERVRLTPSRPRRALLLAVLAGVVCARAGHVLANWPAYDGQEWTALQFWLPGHDVAYGIAASVAVALLVLRSAPPRERARELVALTAGASGGLALGAAVLVGALWLSPAGPRERGVLPDVHFLDTAGQAVDTGDLRGGIAVLNFWATWCAPCRREMPVLQAAADAWRERGVTVVGLNLGESLDVVRSFAARAEVRYPLWIDPPGSDESPSRGLFEALRGGGVPSTWFVGPEGELLDVYTGELDPAFLQRRLRALSAPGG